jgi:hypothetical protein
VRLLVGLICLVLLGFLLAEFFIVFLLPRRVRRDPAIARGILRVLWVPWRAGAGLLPRAAADTVLGFFGPLGLLAILAMLSSGPPSPGRLLERSGQPGGCSGATRSGISPTRSARDGWSETRSRARGSA